MSSNILMPALSPTMEKGNLAKWLKQVGDAVKAGDVIAEIETDKATMEVEAVDEGVLARIVVPEGTQDVPVNELIGVIAAEGEDVEAVAKGGGQGSSTGNGSAGEKPASGAVAEQASSPSKTPEKAAIAPAGAASSQPGVNGTGSRVFSSPLARRIAKDAGIDLAAVAGSGPHGRVIERDVKQAMAVGKAPAGPTPSAAPAPAAAAPTTQVTQSKPAQPAPAAAPAGMADETIKKLFASGSFEETAHDGMRKTIARRLQEAKQTIPHFYLSLDCELDALMALREQINASAPQVEGKPAFKISVNDFVIKALALSLKRVPDANVTWTQATMLKHHSADVGVAVSIPGGLITPVVRNADVKTLSAISAEMKDFAARAKTRRLKPSEYEGGTTAVSNLGMFGIKNFQAVINPPHATILAVGAGEQRVVVRAGAPAVATVMTVTLSTDHRAVDGALGAQLMQAFKRFIETPMAMLV